MAQVNNLGVLGNASVAGIISGNGSGITDIDAGNISSGILPLSQGGTGAGAQAGAFTNIVAPGGTVTGATTFSGGVTFSGTTFNYSGIQNATANSSRNVWFSDSATLGKPCYNDNLKYNPSTNILTVGQITGNAANVTGTVAIAHGGTGATTALTALTALGGPSILSAGTAITSGTNIDTGLEYGTYYSGSASVTSGLLGTQPVSAGYKIFNIKGYTGENYNYQLASSSLQRYMIRQRTGSTTWGDWRLFVTIPQNTNNSNYSQVGSSSEAVYITDGGIATKINSADLKAGKDASGNVIDVESFQTTDLAFYSSASEGDYVYVKLNFKATTSANLWAFGTIKISAYASTSVKPCLIPFGFRYNSNSNSFTTVYYQDLTTSLSSLSVFKLTDNTVYLKIGRKYQYARFFINVYKNSDTHVNCAESASLTAPDNIDSTSEVAATLTNISMISANNSPSTKIEVGNPNGIVSIMASTNRGLYDGTSNDWIIAKTADNTRVYVPKWSSIGSSSRPVFFNSNGEPEVISIPINNSHDLSLIGWYDSGSSSALQRKSNIKIATTGTDDAGGRLIIEDSHAFTINSVDNVTRNGWFGFNTSGSSFGIYSSTPGQTGYLVNLTNEGIYKIADGKIVVNSNGVANLGVNAGNNTNLTQQTVIGQSIDDTSTGFNASTTSFSSQLVIYGHRKVVALELYRGDYGSWQIRNQAADLYLSSNYTTGSVGDYVDVLKIKYNTGVLTLTNNNTITPRASSDTNGLGLTLSGTTVGTFKGDLTGNATTATTAINATNAVNDSDGVEIRSNYVTGVSIVNNGATLRYTTGDGDNHDAPITITASAVSGTTKLVDTDGNDLNVGTSSSPVYFSNGVPVRIAKAGANKVYAGPSSGTSSNYATFRSLVAADIPNLNASKITAGTLPVARGGTGATTLPSGALLQGNGTSAVTKAAAVGDSTTPIFINSSGVPTSVTTKLTGTFTLPNTGWTAAGNYYKFIYTNTVLACTSSTYIHLAPQIDSSDTQEIILKQRAFWNNIISAEVGTNKITFYCLVQPNATIFEAIPLIWERNY